MSSHSHVLWHCPGSFRDPGSLSQPHTTSSAVVVLPPLALYCIATATRVLSGTKLCNQPLTADSSFGCLLPGILSSISSASAFPAPPSPSSDQTLCHHVCVSLFVVTMSVSNTRGRSIKRGRIWLPSLPRYPRFFHPPSDFSSFDLPQISPVSLCTYPLK